MIAIGEGCRIERIRIRSGRNCRASVRSIDFELHTGNGDVVTRGRGCRDSSRNRRVGSRRCHGNSGGCGVCSRRATDVAANNSVILCVRRTNSAVVRRAGFQVRDSDLMVCNHGRIERSARPIIRCSAVIDLRTCGDGRLPVDRHRSHGSSAGGHIRDR